MNYLDLLRAQFNNSIDLVEKRSGILQLIAPLYHEDGDMVDIFIDTHNEHCENVRVSDFGITLMRLSYNYDIDSPNRQKIFKRILKEGNVTEDKGCLYIDTTTDRLYSTILQFSQTIIKVSSMKIYKREVIQNLFYEQLDDYISNDLIQFCPVKKQYPIPERNELEVDWVINSSRYPLYLFGIKDEAKARLVTISCLEFQKARLDFRSIIIHEEFESLPKNDRSRITSAADKQFVTLDDFKRNSIEYLSREIYTSA